MTAGTIDRADTEETLAGPPAWMLRWGNLAFLAMVVLAFIVAAFVPYPDSIKGKATIASDPQPALAVARMSGALTILVADGARVEAGHSLAVIETTAHLGDVRALRWRTGTLACPDSDRQECLPPMRVGELQPHYAVLLEAVHQWRDLADDPRATGNEMELALEIDHAERQWLADRAQVASLEARAHLAQSFRDRTKALFAEKLVSKQDLERAESALLDARSAIESGRAGMAMSAARATRYRQALADFRDGRALQLAQRSRAIEQARQNLLAQLDQWEALHVVTAPHAGRVWFLPAAVDQQHVGTEQPLMMVLPERWRAVARIEVPLHRSGRIAAGQNVAIELAEYPKSEYGPLRGTVARIAPMARDERYVIDAELSADSLAKFPAFRPGTTGMARIVTRDRSILARLFERLISTDGTP